MRRWDTGALVTDCDWDNQVFFSAGITVWTQVSQPACCPQCVHRWAHCHSCGHRLYQISGLYLQGPGRVESLAGFPSTSVLFIQLLYMGECLQWARFLGWNLILVWCPGRQLWFSLSPTNSRHPCPEVVSINRYHAVPVPSLGSESLQFSPRISQGLFTAPPADHFWLILHLLDAWSILFMKPNSRPSGVTKWSQVTGVKMLGRANKEDYMRAVGHYHKGKIEEDRTKCTPYYQNLL